MSQEQDMRVLTPEHVEIRLLPAGLGSRFVAAFVDLVVVVALQTALKQVVPGSLGEVMGRPEILPLSLALYSIYCEMRHQGRSLGKRMLNLRVVDRRGLPLGLQQAFLRNIVRTLDMAPVLYGLGALACFLDKHHRRLGDLAADTLVIQERQPLEYAGAMAGARPDNSLRNARVARLIRHRIGLEEREFLLALCLRARALDDKARFDLMEDVGSHYRSKLEIDDPHLSGENLVRGLTALLFESKLQRAPSVAKSEG